MKSAAQFVNGDYVITGTKNAFNGKTSWWISKCDCILAAYCFTADQESEIRRQLDRGWLGYIDLFESMLAASTTPYLLGEVIFDMTLCARSYIDQLLAEHKWPEFDSRDLYNAIWSWAVAFESTVAYPDGEYIEAVDAFAAEKLREYFGGWT